MFTIYEKQTSEKRNLERTETWANGVEGERILGRTKIHSINGVIFTH